MVRRRPRLSAVRPGGVDDRALVAVAAGVATVCWVTATGGAAAVITVAAVAALATAAITTRARRPVALLALVVVAAAGVRAERSWDGNVPHELGSYEGWATVVVEAGPAGPARRLVVEIDGDRFEIWARARSHVLRVAEWSTGQLVLVSGDRRALEASRQRRVAWQHVVGEFQADWLGDAVAGRPLDRGADRIRDVVARGAATLPAADAALLSGLVIGDDADQPAAMIERFRASGLAHLSAVSGQNVAIVIAAAGPVLRRLRPWSRWFATLALIGWFAVLTRLEPSVLRAGTMAGLAATSFVLGGAHQPRRILMGAVVGLLIVDPLLVTSVGFALSVGATGGLVVLAGPLQHRLRRLGPLAPPLAVTVAAQAGVAVPSLLVFGRLSVVGIVLNLVAVPIAGAVMLYGLPAVLVAGTVPAIGPVVLAPALVGVRAIDGLARIGAAIEPHGWAAVGWWLALAAALGAVAWPVRHNDPDVGAAVPR